MSESTKQIVLLELTVSWEDCLDESKERDVGEGCMTLKDPKHLGMPLKICPEASDLCIRFKHSAFHSDV